MGSLGWAVAVLPRVLASTEQPRLGEHASNGPITLVVVSFVGASAGLPFQAWVQEPSYCGPQASHLQRDDFIGLLTLIIKDSNLSRPAWA